MKFLFHSFCWLSFLERFAYLRKQWRIVTAFSSFTVILSVRKRGKQTKHTILASAQVPPEIVHNNFQQFRCFEFDTRRIFLLVSLVIHFFPSEFVCSFDYRFFSIFFVLSIACHVCHYWRYTVYMKFSASKHKWTKKWNVWREIVKMLTIRLEPGCFLLSAVFFLVISAVRALCVWVGSFFGINFRNQFLFVV